MIVEIEDLQQGYVGMVREVRDFGDKVAPRGMKTREIRDATFRVLDTTKLMPVGVGRELKPAIGAAEALLLVSGLHSPSLMTNVSPTFKRFLNGGDLHGGYGRRVGPQFHTAYERLLRDKDSRQAIISIWDPFYDGLQTRDLPCTLSFGFHIRNDELHMSATMRSNDVWLGLAYDAWMFGQLGWTMAHAIGIPFGSYTHHAYSLHLYERNFEDTEKLHDFDGLDYFSPIGFGEHAVHDAGECQERAARIYDGELPVDATESEEWYEATLAPYDRLTATDNFSS